MFDINMIQYWKCAFQDSFKISSRIPFLGKKTMIFFHLFLQIDLTKENFNEK